MPDGINEKVEKEELQAELFLKLADSLKECAGIVEELSSLLKTEKKENKKVESTTLTEHTDVMSEKVNSINNENTVDVPPISVNVAPVTGFVPNPVENTVVNNEMPKMQESILPTTNDVVLNKPETTMPNASLEMTVEGENYIKEVHPAPEHLRNQRPGTIPVQQLREQSIDAVARAL